MPYGIDSTGFVPKPLEDVKADLESGFRASFGSGITTEPQSAFGQIIGLFSDRLADLWQLGQAVYNASFPDGASGVALDNLCALTGVARLPASYTYVTVTATGVNGTVIGTGFKASTTAGVQFENQSSQTISGGTATLTMRAGATGPFTAPAGSLTVIDTPIAGLTSITNAADQYLLGSDIESDSALRLRRVLTIRAIGNAATESIRADLLEVQGVTACNVFENVTDSTDAQGLPPHSFEAVVDGTYTAGDIRAAIWASKPAGIASYGTSSGTIVDSSGTTQTVKFSPATVLNIYVDVTVTVDASLFPVGGDADVKAAIAAYGDTNYTIGSKVISSALIPSVFTAVDGIKDVSLPKIGTAPSPTLTTTISPTNRQRPDLDTSRITVTIVYA